MIESSGELRERLAEVRTSVRVVESTRRPSRTEAEHPAELERAVESR
jgi:hypothetical protein